jgi:membrane-bound serine protease (ClpP class)
LARHVHLGILVYLGALAVALSLGASSGREVVVLRYSGAIGPVSADYIDRGIAEAEQQNALALVLELDTPGGLDRSMRHIIQRELNARVPIVVYVAPRGARAASAGCLITLAADVAAMAPGTNIGAAHPVGAGGGPLTEKIVNDAAAYARSLAALRGRNEDWAEKAVRESVSVTADQAVALRVVDLEANNLDDLLARLNGRTVKTPEGTIQLNLAGATLRSVPMDWRERLLNGLSDPNVAYLLFDLGLLGIIAELFAPHGFITGSVGTVAFILGLVGLAMLPVQAVGAVLLIAGMILLALELKIGTHGLLTVAGLAAFIFGSLLLLERVPGYQISRLLILGMAAGWIVVLGVVVRLVLRARRLPALMGTGRLVGAVGVAKTELAPRGVVLLGGEDWDAESEETPVGRGEKVRVVEVAGLTLRVRKLS